MSTADLAEKTIATFAAQAAPALDGFSPSVQVRAWKVAEARPPGQREMVGVELPFPAGTGELR